ncbi:TPA: hypothetical protein U5Z07_000726 [Streptococcus agalactiae]|nr:hypothetical protein [Streptococcus agalactiae]
MLAGICGSNKLSDKSSCFQQALPFAIALAFDQLSHGGLAMIKSGWGSSSSVPNSLLSPNNRE